MNRPASFGQHCRMGKSSSENLSRRITFLQGPLATVEEPLGRLHIHEAADAIGNVIQRFNSERQVHTPLRSELVDQHSGAGIALYIFEQQRRTAGRSVPAGGALRHSIGYLGDFQDRVYFGRNALQFAGTLQRSHPVTQVIVGQESLLSFGYERYKNR